MDDTLETEGYSIHRSVISAEFLTQCREEANRIADKSGSSCVRHLRERSAFFNEFAFCSELKNLLPADLRPVRSILFDKNKKENWTVAWHQDLTIALREKKEIDGYGPWSTKDGYRHVQPPHNLLDNMVTVRIHLDNTNSSNGALKIIPKSHRLGKISSSGVSDHIRKGEVFCECDEGDVLLMKPLILHSSLRSELPSRRRVIHIEYALDEDLDSSLEWAEPIDLENRIDGRL